jgi:nucleotide-binding universal stress UspA family protein
MAHRPATPPTKILLATDLRGRSDRALDRATELANAWDAELVVVHALEDDAGAGGATNLPSWRRPPDSAQCVERQIRDDLRGPCPRLRFHIEEGQPLKVILEAGRREEADLLIVAMGPAGAAGKMSRTVDELFRRFPASMLVVKRRPNGPYRHLLVGTDFTDEARMGLETAARLFPSAALSVMHADETTYSNLYLDPTVSDRSGPEEKEPVLQWLARADLAPGVREGIVTLVEHGPPEALLSAFVEEKGADLTVIGAYERSRLFHVMVGGRGPKIVQAAPSDVLIVRAGREAGEHAPA